MVGPLIPKVWLGGTVHLKMGGSIIQGPKVMLLLGALFLLAILCKHQWRRSEILFDIYGFDFPDLEQNYKALLTSFLLAGLGWSEFCLNRKKQFV